MVTLDEIESYLQELIRHDQQNIIDIPGKLNILRSYRDFCIIEYLKLDQVERGRIFGIYLNLCRWIELYMSF